jgi:hypothetical protein
MEFGRRTSIESLGKTPPQLRSRKVQDCGLRNIPNPLSSFDGETFPRDSESSTQRSLFRIPFPSKVDWPQTKI